MTHQTRRIAESNSTSRAELSITLPPTRRLPSAKFTAQFTPVVSRTPAPTKAMATHVTSSQESRQSGDDAVVVVCQIQTDQLSVPAMIDHGVETIPGHDHERKVLLAQHRLKLFPFG